MSIKEKRSKQRINIRVNLKFGQDNLEHEGVSRNLSPDGMSIVSDKALPPNSNIKIQIHQSNGHDISVEGKVVWVSTPPGMNSMMGIKFINPNQELLNIYQSRSRYKS